MYKTIKRLYEQGKLNEFGLDVAIARGWITVDQKAEIMAN